MNFVLLFIFSNGCFLLVQSSTQITADIYSACNTVLLDSRFLDYEDMATDGQGVSNPTTFYRSHVLKDSYWYCRTNNESSVKAELNLNHDMVITGVQISGKDATSYVKAFSVFYSYDKDWSNDYFKESFTDSPVIFRTIGDPSADPWSLHQFNFSFPFVARSVRLDILDHEGEPCFHWSPVGCYQEKFSCQRGFFRIGLHCYKLNETKVTWEEANEQCNAEQSELIIIEDFVESKLVRDILPQAYWLPTYRGDNLVLSWNTEYLNNSLVVYANWDDTSSPLSDEYLESRRLDEWFIDGLKSIQDPSSLKWFEISDSDARHNTGVVCRRQRNDQPCEYQEFGSSCFFANQTLASGFSYDIAHYMCAKEGYEMAFISYQNEQTFYNDIILLGPWTGVHSVPGTSDFYLGNNSTMLLPEVNWTYWVTAEVTGLSEPSVFKLDLDCILVHSNYPGYDNWEDVNCNSTNHFACQYQLGSGVTECGEGWELIDGFCILLYRYRTTWENATFVCGFMNASLVTVRSDLTQQFLTDSLNYDYWIGLNGINNAGTFTWDGNDELFDLEYSFENWDSLVNFNYLTNYSHTCVAMDGVTGFWHFKDCESQRKFICQKHPFPSAAPQLAVFIDDCGLDTSLPVSNNTDNSSTVTPSNDVTSLDPATSHTDFYTIDTPSTEYQTELYSTSTIPTETQTDVYAINTPSPESHNGSSTTNSSAPPFDAGNPNASRKKRYAVQNSTVCQVPHPTVWYVWELSEKNGALDLSGNGKHGLTSAVNTVTGPYGGNTTALQFYSAENSRVNIRNLNRIQGQSFSISFHAMPNGERSAFFQFEKTSVDNVFGLFYQEVNGTMHLVLNGMATPIEIPYSCLPETWYHFGIAYDHSYGDLQMYVDGEIVFDHVIGHVEFEMSLTINLGLAKLRSGLQDIRFLNTLKLSCFQIYDRQLTAAEIRNSARYCLQLQSNEVEKVVFCNHSLASLSCPTNSYINILYSQFGRASPYTQGICTSMTFDRDNDLLCVASNTAIVTSYCHRQQACSFPVFAGEMVQGAGYICTQNWDVNAYLEIYYNCQESVPCEEGALYRDGICYFMGYTDRSWHASSEYCATHWSKLATVSDQLTQDDIYELAYSGLWIGYNDRTEEGVYEWDSNSLSSNYTRWAPEFPLQPSLAENCVVIGYEDDDVRMNDYVCDERRPFICKTKYNATICTRYRLHPGESMYVGDILCTEDGNYTAKIQDDGNFVVQGPDKHDITYASMTTSAVELYFNVDGEMGIKDEHGVRLIRVLTGCTGDCTVGIADGGLLAIYTANDHIVYSGYLVDCKRTPQGKDYQGTVGVAKDGRLCRQWSNVSWYDRFLLSEWAPLTRLDNHCRHINNDEDTPECYPDDQLNDDHTACHIPTCRSALPGYDLYKDRCRSVIEDITNATKFLYSPDTFNDDPGFSEGMFMARNIKYSTGHIADQQLGGVCLSNIIPEWPAYVTIELARREKVHGIVMREGDGPSYDWPENNRLQTGLRVLYGDDTENLRYHRDILTPLAESALQYGTTMFSPGFYARYVQFYPKCESSNCGTTKECFRIDLLTCSDNHIYLENYPQFSMPTFSYSTRESSDFGDSDLGTENSTGYVPSPSIALEVNEAMYLVRLEINASSTYQNLHPWAVYTGQEYDNGLHNTLQYETFPEPTSNLTICYTSDTPLNLGQHVDIRCEYTSPGTMVYIVSLSDGVYDRLAISDIKLYKGNELFEYAYRSSMHDEALLEILTPTSDNSEDPTPVPVIGGHVKVKTSGEMGTDRYNIGTLNDGLLVEGNCFSSIPYVMPVIFITLPKLTDVAEVRVTSAYDDPVDDLVDLNIDVFEESIDMIDLNFHYPRFGNFYENLDPFTPGETRSLTSDRPIWGRTIILYKNSPEESLFRLCELEIYDSDDHTDISEPSWESDWIEVVFDGSDIHEVITHDLEDLPIYGRLMLEVLQSSTGAAGFIYEAMPSLSDMTGVQMQYTESTVTVSATPMDGTLYCPRTSSWTQSISSCIHAGDLFRYKVQLWLFCDFPRPALLSEWKTVVEMASFDYSLTNMPSFAIAQVRNSSGVTQATGGTSVAIAPDALSFMYGMNSAKVTIPYPSTVQVRILLWHQLGSATPDMQQTFALDCERGGEEVIRMPPFSPLNSFVHVVLHARVTNGNLSMTSPTSRSLSNFIAYNHKHMRLWWRLACGPNPNIEYTGFTVTVYRAGAPKSGLDCSPLTLENTNLFMQCDSPDGAIEGYLNHGDADIDLTSQCVNTSLGFHWTVNDTSFIGNGTADEVWYVLAGYEHKFVSPASFDEAVTLCDSYNARVIYFTSQVHYDKAVEWLEGRNMTFFLDAFQTLAIADVLNISDVIQDLLRSDSRVYQSYWDETLYYNNPEVIFQLLSNEMQELIDMADAYDGVWPDSTGNTTIASGNDVSTCLSMSLLLNGIVSFDVIDCDQQATVVCMRPVCANTRNMQVIAHEYKKPNVTDTVEPHRIWTQCHRECRHELEHCEMLGFDTEDNFCHFYENVDPLLDVHAQNPLYYGSFTTFTYECRRVKEPLWELVLALDVNAPNNSEALSDLENFVAIFESTEIREGPVSSVHHLFANNMSFFKSERIVGWDYVSHMKMEFMTSDGGSAYIYIDVAGRLLESWEDFFPSVLSSSFPVAHYDFLEPIFLDCVNDIENRTFFIAASNIPCDGGSPVDGDPQPHPVIMYKNSSEWISAEKFAIYFNTFCYNMSVFGFDAPVPYLSVDVRHTTFYGPMAFEHGLRICLEKYEGQCTQLGVEIQIFQTIEHMVSSKTFAIYAWRNGRIVDYIYWWFTAYDRVWTTQNWLKWTDGLLEFGADSGHYAGYTSLLYFNFEIPFLLDVHYLSFEPEEHVAYLNHPIEVSCPPLILENTTDTHIEASGSCMKHIECEIGYELFNSELEYTTVCQHDGTWRPVWDCNIIFCPEVTLNNTDAINATAYYLQQVLVTCDEEHYAFADENVTSYFMTCQLNKTFTPEEPCQRLPCYSLTIEHSDTQDLIAEYNTSVNVTCEFGYEISPDVNWFETTCLGNRSWSINIECLPKPCPVLSIEHSNVTNATGSYGDFANISCLLGYQKEAPCQVTHGPANQISTATAIYPYDLVCEDGGSVFQIGCNGNGEWQGVDNCTNVPCPDLALDGFNVSTLHGVYDDRIPISCRDGFYLESNGTNSIIAYCNETANWDSLGVCQRVRCEEQKFEHGQTISTSAPLTVNQSLAGIVSGVFEDTVTVSCIPGYYFPHLNYSVLNTTCQHNASWTVINSTVCAKQPCLDLIIPNSNASTPISGIYEDTLTIKCDEDFYETTSTAAVYASSEERIASVTCSETQSWMPHTQCLRLPCYNLTVEHGNAIDYVAPYGETVTVTCDFGHGVSPGVDSFETTCLQNRSWSVCNECLPKPCPVISIENSNAVNASGAFGDATEVSCLPGYQKASPCLETHGTATIAAAYPFNLACADGIHDSVFQIGCNADGEWQSVDNCTNVPCANTTLEYSNITILEGVYADRVSVSCLEGFYIQHNETNSFVAFCDETANWIGVELCQRKRCEDQRFEHAQTSSTSGDLDIYQSGDGIASGLYEDTVTVTCFSGFHFPQLSSSTLSTTCQADSHWTVTNSTTCEPQPCSELIIPNSNASSPVTGTYGDTVTIQCDVGYLATTLMGTVAPNPAHQRIANLTCNETHTWTPLTECQIANCGYISPTPFLTVILFYFETGVRIDITEVTVAYNTIYGSLLHVECVDGYGHLEGNSTVTCQEDATWSEVPYCYANCPEITVTNGNLSTTSRTYLTIVTVECNEGYELVGVNTLQCVHGGSSSAWNDGVPLCQLQACEPLTIAESNAQSVEARYTESVTVVCDPGYVHPDTGQEQFQAACLIDTSWDFQHDGCIARECPVLAVANAAVNPQTGNYLDVASVACHTGYNTTYGDSYDLVCNSSGHWENVENCERVVCGDPPDPAPSSGVMYSTSQPEFSLGVYQERMYVECEAGYSGLEGSSFIECQANASWIAPPVCHADCTNLSIISPATVHVVDDAGSLVLVSGGDPQPYLTDIQVQCPDNFIPEPAAFLTCERGGLWSQPEATCTYVDCGPPPNVTNGMLVTVNVTTHYQSRVEYRCAEAYGMRGVRWAECLYGGSWSSPPICYNDCPLLTPPEYGTLSNALAIIGNWVVVTCVNESFTVDNSEPIKCLADGAWTGPVPQCYYDGYWREWSSWTPCSASCWGDKYRNRTCVPPAGPGSPCPGSDSEVRGCEEHPCVANGQWGAWHAWGTCSASCAGGRRMRTRSCDGPYGGGAPCVGVDSEEGDCNTGECPLVSCPEPPSYENTELLGSSRTVGTRLVYLCQRDNYEYEDGTDFKFVTCTSYGVWDPPTLPQCYLVKCPELNLYPHMSINTDERYLDTIIEFSCDIGYEMPSGQTHSSTWCMEGQQWSHPVPECRPVTCEASGRLVLSEGVSQSEVHSLSYLDQATFTCEDGSRLQHGMHTDELECGVTTDAYDACTTGRCPPVPLVSNSRVVYQDDYLVTYECFVGHRFENGYQTQDIQCINEAWDPVFVGACLIITCPPVPRLSHTSANTTSAIYGSYAQLTCHSGYIFPDNSSDVTISCENSGNWSYTPDDCIEVYCGPPPVVYNASEPIFTNMTLGATANYSCDPFHRLSDGHTERSINCTIYGVWQGVDEACRLERCEPVPLPQHAWSNTTRAVIDTIVNITCDRGYVFSDLSLSTTIECDRYSKLWTETPEDCQPPEEVANAIEGVAVECTPLVASAHMQLSSDDHHFPDVINVTCDYGYELLVEMNNGSVGMGYIQTECLYDQTWSRDLATMLCQRVRCSAEPQVTHATNHSQGSHYGDTVLYVCHHGFTFQDTGNSSRHIHCLGTREWSELPPPCEIITCPALPSWNNLIINSTSTLFHTHVRATCASDYKFQGNDYQEGMSVNTICDANSAWNPSVPDCMEITVFYTPPPPKESSGATTIGTVILFILAFLGVAIVVIDVITYVDTARAILATNLGHWFPFLIKPVTPPKRKVPSSTCSIEVANPDVAMEDSLNISNGAWEDPDISEHAQTESSPVPMNPEPEVPIPGSPLIHHHRSCQTPVSVGMVSLASFPSTGNRPETLDTEDFENIDDPEMPLPLSSCPLVSPTSPQQMFMPHFPGPSVEAPTNFIQNDPMHNNPPSQPTSAQSRGSDPTSRPGSAWGQPMNSSGDPAQSDFSSQPNSAQSRGSNPSSRPASARGPDEEPLSVSNEMDIPGLLDLRFT